MEIEKYDVKYIELKVVKSTLVFKANLNSIIFCSSNKNCGKISKIFVGSKR